MLDKIKELTLLGYIVNFQIKSKSLSVTLTWNKGQLGEISNCQVIDIGSDVDSVANCLDFQYKKLNAITHL